MCHYVPQRPAHRSRTVSHVSFKWMLNCVGLIIDFSISTDTHTHTHKYFCCFVTGMFSVSLQCHLLWLALVYYCLRSYLLPLCVSLGEPHGLHIPSGSERHKSPLGSGQEGLVSNSNMHTCYCEPVGQAESSFSPHWCDRWTRQI